MRKIFFLLSFLLIGSALFAQEQSSVSEQYFFKSLSNRHSISAGFSPGMSFNSFMPHDYNRLPGYFAAYSYRVTKWLEVEGRFITYHSKEYDYGGYNATGELTDGVLTENKAIGLCANAKILWLNKKYFSFYSGIGYGIGINTNSISNFKGFNPNERTSRIERDKYPLSVGGITIFGMKAGRRLYGIFELMIGTPGTFVFGVGYKL